MMLLSSISAFSQEIPRPSLARQKSVEPPPSGSNLKIGPVHITAEAALNAEYIDNINLTEINPIGDFVITPELGIAAAWRATTLNTLRFRTTFSFAKYLEHSEFDQQNLTISPDSALSFKIYTGDFRIDLHDRFSLQNETRDRGSVNGISSLPRFENTIGIGVLWDLNYVTWFLGYDHYSFTTLGSALIGDGSQSTDLSRLDHTTDQLSTSFLIRLNPALVGGLEATASYSAYPDESVTDFTAFSCGPFVQAQLTPYTSINASIGIKGYSVDENASPSQGKGTNTGYYATLSFVHRLNRYYTDRLELGHEDEADALSGRTTTDYVRYAAEWNANSRLVLAGHAFLEDVHQETSSPIGPTPLTDYRQYGFGVTLAYHFTEKSSLGLTYQFTKQDTDSRVSSFEQNRVSLRLGYQF
jgi:hypothetical protein